ncbi:MAG: response regulator [Bacteroidia bacterium]|nr:response regulator [Bacteroidia bacterium]
MIRILLIEDNEDVRETTAEILELANYTVYTAENGREGIQKAKELVPDLIICDIMMPEKDGYEVLYYLGRDPKTSTIPFVFLTAKSEKGDIRHGMNLGADDYLTKPFEELDLLNCIETRLEKAKIFQKEFSKSAEGVVEFINEARGLKELEGLSGDKKLKSFKKGDGIYWEGDFPHFIYYIQSGRAKATKMNADGKELIIHVYKPGDFLGYLSILKDVNYTESLIALDDVEAFRIPRQDFLDLLNKNRDVAARMIKLLSGELIEKEEELLALAYDSVRQRTAKALLMLWERYSEGENASPKLVIAREELANIVGTAKETVIRMISEFKDEGLIRMEGRKIVIDHPEKLAKII